MSYFFKLPLITELTIGQQGVLNEPGAFAVCGGPGTGKSVVSLWRHIRNYDLGKRKSLLLTYTITLERYLSASAASVNADAGRAVDRTYDWTTKRASKYEEIIIDEAQDVEDEKYEIIKKQSNIVCYGADDQQIVWPRRASTQEKLESIFPSNNRYELDENFRNSYEVLYFIKALFPNKLIPEYTLKNLISENRRGNKPILLVFNNNYEKQNNSILDIIKIFNSPNHNIAILVPLIKHVKEYHDIIKSNGIKCSKYETTDGQLLKIENVHITTFKSAKGTEFDTVIIPNFHDMHSNIASLNVVEENDYYVALTRAKRNLYLLSASSSISFLKRSEQQKATYNEEIAK